MICKNCGKEFNEDMDTCPYCLTENEEGIFEILLDDEPVYTKQKVKPVKPVKPVKEGKPKRPRSMFYFAFVYTTVTVLASVFYRLTFNSILKKTEFYLSTYQNTVSGKLIADKLKDCLGGIVLLGAFFAVLMIFRSFAQKRSKLSDGQLLERCLAFTVIGMLTAAVGDSLECIVSMFLKSDAANQTLSALNNIVSTTAAFIISLILVGKMANIQKKSRENDVTGFDGGEPPKNLLFIGFIYMGVILISRLAGIAISFGNVEHFKVGSLVSHLFEIAAIFVLYLTSSKILKGASLVIAEKYRFSFLSVGLASIISGIATGLLMFLLTVFIGETSNMLRTQAVVAAVESIADFAFTGIFTYIIIKRSTRYA